MTVLHTGDTPPGGIVHSGLEVELACPGDNCYHIDYHVSVDVTLTNRLK